MSSYLEAGQKKLKLKWVKDKPEFSGQEEHPRYLHYSDDPFWKHERSSDVLGGRKKKEQNWQA